MVNPQRNQSLDVLRAIAVFLVMGRHMPAYTTLERGGWIGVDLFFVLSGYLISMLLFREFQFTGAINVRRFLLRRGFKIWPAYYVLLIVTVSIFAIAGFPISWSKLAASIFFLQNYYFFDVNFLRLGFYHTWSLAVEEHFYIVLPLLLVALSKLRSGRDPFKAVPWIFLILAVSCASLRWFTLKPPSFMPAPFSHLRADGLFAGVLLGYLHSFRPETFLKISKSWLAPAIAILCSAPAFVFDGNTRVFQSFGLTLLLVGFSFLVAWAVPHDASKLFGRRIAFVLAAIGAYSYSIYLWHLLLSSMFQSGRPPSQMRFWIYVATSTVIGIIASELIERPMLRLREKWMSVKPL